MSIAPVVTLHDSPTLPAPQALQYATALPLAPDPSKPEQMLYGDAVRILGTIAVVIGHVCDMSLFSIKPLSADWHVLNFVDAATRWAVPAYIMLSGALLLDPARAESPQRFYKKRLARIGVPLVFWTAFFIWFSVEFTRWSTVQDALTNLLLGKPYVHLHFIFRIAGLYAFTPMFRIFLKHISRPMLIGTVVLVLCMSSLDSLMNCIMHTEYSAFARFGPFVGYYLCGYLLREFYISRGGLICCWIGFLLTVLMLALGTNWTISHFPSTDPGGRLDGPPSMQMILYDFLSPVRVVMALLSWVILINTFGKKQPAGRLRGNLIRNWAAATLGLYLVHPAFREILYLKGLGPLWPKGISATTFSSVWIGIPVTAVLVYIPALITTWVIERIPGLRRVVG